MNRIQFLKACSYSIFLAPTLASKSARGDTTPQPQLFIVAFGINEYENIPDAKFATAELQTKALVASLKNETVNVFSCPNPRKLFSDADSNNIIAILESISKTATADDVFVFIFSGRIDYAGKMPSIFPTDAKMVGGTKPTNIIRADNLFGLFDKIACMRRIVILSIPEDGFDNDSKDMLEAFCSVLSRPSQTDPDGKRVLTFLAGPGGTTEDSIVSRLVRGLKGDAFVRQNATKIVTAGEIARYVKASGKNVGIVKAKDEKLAEYALVSDKPFSLIADNRGAPGVGTLPKPAGEVAPGKNYALLFATDHYDDQNSLATLKGPIYDARTLGSVLQQKFGFEKPEIMTDPTCEEVYKKFDEYKARKTNDGDQLLIFFAGHGLSDSETKDGCLAFKDSKIAAHLAANNNVIWYRPLSHLIDNLPFRHIGLILDSCHSGTFDPTMMRESTSVMGVERFSPYVRYLNQLKYEKTRICITSGRDTAVQDVDKSGHSPFINVLLDLLQKTGDSRTEEILTFGEIAGDMQKIKLTSSPHLCSFGEKYTSGADFAFFAGKK